MPRSRPAVTVGVVKTDDSIAVLVLQEFRLRAADDGAAAARIVAASPSGVEPAIPLLTSIEDRRDVAIVRALHSGEATEADGIERAGLDHLVSSWSEPKLYGPRIAERSETPSSSFRLAVTESGINGGDVPITLGADSAAKRATRHPIGLVWIAAPVGSHAGLLILLGGYEEPQPVEGDSPGWPLPLSRDLGVRIYENTPA
jgi:hypothetical protein